MEGGGDRMGFFGVGERVDVGLVIRGWVSTSGQGGREGRIGCGLFALGNSGRLVSQSHDAGHEREGEQKARFEIKGDGPPAQ